MRTCTYFKILYKPLKNNSMEIRAPVWGGTGKAGRGDPITPVWEGVRPKGAHPTYYTNIKIFCTGASPAGVIPMGWR